MHRSLAPSAALRVQPPEGQPVSILSPLSHALMTWLHAIGVPATDWVNGREMRAGVFLWRCSQETGLDDPAMGVHIDGLGELLRAPRPNSA